MTKQNEATPVDSAAPAATESPAPIINASATNDKVINATIINETTLDETMAAETPIDNQAAALDPDALNERIAELQAANVDLAGQFLRAKAEAENTRRIATKETEKARKFALEKFAKELLQVKDSLDQATQVDLSNNSGEQIIKQMQEGLTLTTKQLNTIFARFHIEELKPAPEAVVDPELHQAMTMQPSPTVAQGKIISVIQSGYRLNTRLLRPAMVIVSSGK